MPYSSMKGNGSTTLPVVLLIFSPPLSTYPWIISRRGSSRPAAISSAGQITAWNFRMSLAMSCRSGGQKRLQVLARARVPQGGAVVEQRVDPDVDRLARVPRHRDAPLDLGAGDGEVLEAVLDHPPRLVAAGRRQHPVGVRVVVRQQALAVGGEPEEPVLLLQPLHRRAVDRAQPSLEQLVLAVEALARRAVPAAVAAAVDVAGLVDALEDALHLRLVLGVGGADEEVVVASSTPPRARKRSDSTSACSRGVRPSRSAERTTLPPCSSVPVRKKTSSPRWR